MTNPCDSWPEDEDYEEDLPDLDAWERMKIVDSMKPEYRALIYEFGLQPTITSMSHMGRLSKDAGEDEQRARLKLLRIALESYRFGKQKEWFAEDYVLERTAHKSGVQMNVAEIRRRAAGLS